jgi:hypothetical protein
LNLLMLLLVLLLMVLFVCDERIVGGRGR